MLIQHTLRYLPAQLLSPLAQLLSMLLWTHWLSPQDMGVFTLVTVTQEIAYVVSLSWYSVYALRYLPPVLKSFADTHPGIEVAVECLPSVELLPKLRAGELDLSLLSEGEEIGAWPSIELWRGKLRWITSERYAPHRLDPLPLALSRTSCSWGKAAVDALEAAGRRYRVAYTSASQMGTHAPVMAGLAVTVSTISWVPEGLRVVRREEGLPDLPDFGIRLARGRDAQQPVTDVLARHITDTFRGEMRRMDRVA